MLPEYVMEPGLQRPPQPVAAMAWESDASFELEPEPVLADLEPELEPEPIAAAAEAEVEPEPVVAEVEPEPEPEPVPPVAPTPIRPISETILRIPRATPPAPVEERVAAEADDASVAARRAKLDLLGLGDPGEGALGPEPRPAMPYRSSGAAVSPVELAAHRSAQTPPGAGTFWEASAREVAGAVTQIGVQSCGHCGLSLSASARFCRRCGQRQARSA
jgi:ribosomal protein L40E